MIEGFLRERLSTAFPDLIWTENNYEAPDNTGTVYREAGEPPSKYEDDLRFPFYMVWVRSSNWDLAQRVAEGSIDVLNKLHNIEWTDYEGATYQIIFVEAASDANRIGRDESGIMEWSSNFKVTLRRKN
jgi:hypothetical protein